MILGRLGRLVVRTVSALLLAGLIAGIPAGLSRFVGWPLPRHVPTGWAGWSHILTSPFPDKAVINLLALALWITWAAFVHAVAVETIATAGARRRGQRLPERSSRLTPTRALAALLVASIATGGGAGALAATAPPVAATAPATPASAAPPAVARAIDGHLPWRTVTTTEPGPCLVAATGTTPISASVEPAARQAPLPRFTLAAHNGPLTVTAGGQHYTVTVTRGDTLWDLAATWLRDPHRWPEIYQLNADRYDQYGRMRGGDHIEAAWVLALPDDATPPAGAQPADPPEARPGAGTGPGSGASATPPPTGGAAAPAPSPSAAGSTAAPTRTANPAPTQRPGQAAPWGVTLVGGWLDAGLVAALLAAVALVWAHRRRRYTRRPPSPHLRMDDPAVAPMPPVITQMRRRLRTPAPADGGDLPDADAADAGEDVLDIFDNDDADELGGAHDAHEQSPDNVDDHDAEDEGGLPGAVGPPVTPALANSTIAVWPPAGLGLTGPGAEAAARGFLVASLAAGGLEDPEARSQVVIPAGTLATLLGADAVSVPDTPRLLVTAGLVEALATCEEATLHRTRLVFDHEVDTVAGLREADPTEEPLPPLVLIADATASHERARVAAALVQGQRLDIHGILLGAWSAGDTVVVAADGTTTRAAGDTVRHGAHPADVGRLSTVGPDDAADLLRVLGESHTGEPQPTPVHTPPPVPQPIPAATDGDLADAQCPADDHPDKPDRDQQVAGIGLAAGGADQTPAASVESDASSAGVTSAATPALPAEATPAVTGIVEAGPCGGADHRSQSGDEDADLDVAGTGRATVRILGTPHIVGVPSGERLRPQAVELLVYLAVHDEPVHQDFIFEDLMPEATYSRAPHRLDTYIYNLRRLLRACGGPGHYVHRERKTVALNTEAIDCDLWRMRTAITTAAASSGGERIAALRQAVDTYTAPLAGARAYPWIESYQEAVRLQALDATLALIDALADDPEQALALAQAAVVGHPHTEDLACAVMRIHARRDDAAAVRAALADLRRRLGDIDAEPTEATLSLADELLTSAERRARRGRRGGSTP